MTSRSVIALDADGVLLDFNLAYAKAWERAFGEFPRLKDAQAYWPIDRWDVDRVEGERKKQFRACFDEQFWGNVPAIDGAVQACQALVAGGYELVCISALAAQFGPARQRNLIELGFPIERVIATGSAASHRSPKAQALETLKPLAFVDDYLPYLRGLHADMHVALVMREPNGTPNTGPDLSAAHTQHADLADFSRWWLSCRASAS